MHDAPSYSFVHALQDPPTPTPTGRAFFFSVPVHSPPLVGMTSPSFSGRACRHSLGSTCRRAVVRNRRIPADTSLTFAHTDGEVAGVCMLMLYIASSP